MSAYMNFASWDVTKKAGFKASGDPANDALVGARLFLDILVGGTKTLSIWGARD